MRRILVTVPVTSLVKEQMESIAVDAEFTYVAPEDVMKKMVQDADIILGNVLKRHLIGHTHLEWLQLDSSGADAFTEHGLLPEKAILTCATGAYGLSVSEHMIGLVFELQKKLYLYSRNQEDSIWKDEGEVRSIEGSTTLVIGMGDIGSRFAKKMNALGSKVIAIRKNSLNRPSYIDEMRSLDELDDLLGKVDIVALSLPNTSETYHLFNMEKFEKMKSSAIIINVGRGRAIKTEDLCKALDQGMIAGAGLDVFEQEPLPMESPLWSTEHAVLTPHVSGSYHLPATLDAILALMVKNLQAFYDGKPLENMVDFETGYRKFKE